MPQPLATALEFLVQVFFGCLLLAVLLRFLMQLVRADFYNPISQAIIKVTDPMLRPLRRVIPGFRGIDWASLVLAMLVEIAAIVVLYMLQGFTFSLSPLTVLMWAVVGILDLTLNIFFFAMIILVIASWVAPGTSHPALTILHQLTEPLIAPVRRVIPPVAGLDFSPLFVLVGIGLIRILLVDPLTMMVGAQNVQLVGL